MAWSDGKMGIYQIIKSPTQDGAEGVRTNESHAQYFQLGKTLIIVTCNQYKDAEGLLWGVHFSRIVEY